ncbi:endonuclease/exonuclease/phosphatase family protein [Ferrimonas balearica]|uniref:endonuclease/exonuclease/phosphatase family protein n=1 Tax=Ferrimonas balearica TaxID=44012 RepID=UPI001C99302A|nr:endonuclease/exonuclease/phosphatase family protein [Ferrimonas balearica]MBY5991237.1 endonuclease/exonuclease/phosphatase family protein [Ferrimonas balearica]
MSRTLALLALMGTLVGCPMAPEQALTLSRSSPQVQTLPEESIRLLNWNIYKQLDTAQWQHEFGGLLNRHQPHIITLQETNLPSVTLPHLTSEHGYVFAPNLVMSDGQWSGVMTAATAEPSAKVALLSEVTEPVSNTPKVVLLTRYTLAPSGAELLVANIHAINFVTTSEFARQVSALERQLARHQGPMILSGDFNTWSDARLAMLGKATGRLGLVPVTFDDDLRTRFLGSPLDHIFHSADLGVIRDSAQVFHDTQSSDHQPMMVAFEYRAPDRTRDYAVGENARKLSDTSIETVE